MPPTTIRPGVIDDVEVRFLDRNVDERGWLCELFRVDELPVGFGPAMGHMTLTSPGVLRGPREHRWQTNCFCFMGPARMRMCLWDNRAESPTFGVYQEVSALPEQPVCILVPHGVVHSYQNIDDVPGLLLNFPDRLYKGLDRKQPADEIRHEDDPFSPFKADLVPGQAGRKKRLRRTSASAQDFTPQES